jgi:hypothetical protein
VHGLLGAFADAIEDRGVLAEDLVVEALDAEGKLVALVLGGLNGVGGVGRVGDDVLRRRRFAEQGLRNLRGIAGLADLQLSPAPIDENGNAGGAAQQDDQNCCRNGDGEGSPAWSVRAA